MASSTDTSDPRLDARRRRTVVWVVGLATFGLIFDGYDLVVYGTVVSTFLRDPSQIGEVSPEGAGALGSYALIGVLVGALIAGTVGDIIGRRKVMLTAYAWFAIGMGLTALTSTTSLFGLLRFLTGLGVGALVATTGALVAEYAPPGKKNLANAITYSGVPVGSLLAALLAIVLLDLIGWRGMFWIGALPLVTLLPLAFVKMPESVAWLAATGRHDEARRDLRADRGSGSLRGARRSPSGRGGERTRGPGGVRRPIQRHVRNADGAPRVDERYRPYAGLLLEHLATRAHASCRVRGQGFAGVSRWCSTAGRLWEH